MAFEVFDDVAFYWFLMAALFAFIIPMSQSFYSVLPRMRPEENWTRGMKSCEKKLSEVDAAERKMMLSKVFGWRGVGFTVGWIMLISLAVQLTTMQGEFALCMRYLLVDPRRKVSARVIMYLSLQPMRMRSTFSLEK